MQASIAIATLGACWGDAAPELCRQHVQRELKPTAGPEHLRMVDSAFTQDGEVARMIGTAHLTNPTGGKQTFQYDCFLSKRDGKWALDSASTNRRRE